MFICAIPACAIKQCGFYLYNITRQFASSYHATTVEQSHNNSAFRGKTVGMCKRTRDKYRYIYCLILKIYSSKYSTSRLSERRILYALFIDNSALHVDITQRSFQLTNEDYCITTHNTISYFFFFKILKQNKTRYSTLLMFS